MFKRFKNWIISLIIGTAIVAGGYGYLGGDEIEVLDTAKIQEKYNQSIEIKEKYNIQGTELTTKIKHIDDIKIKVGEVGEFKPNAEISLWDEEVKMKVKPKLNFESKNKTLDFENNKIKYREDKKEYHLYEVKKGDETIGGATSTIDAYEFEIILLEKPESNIVEFDIETQGLVFYYQPALNIEMASTTCTETDCGGKHRPENVVGSYAVYHESKQGDYSQLGKKNYRAGKAFHIYRPKIIDKAGTEVWGKLNITDNLLTVEIPQEFLDKAIYPVIVDPTFGYTSIGGTSIATWDICGTLATAPEDGTISSISMYLDNPSGNINFGYYNDNASAVGTHIAHGTAVANPATTAWKTINVSGSIINGNAYWLLGQQDGESNIKEYEDSVGEKQVFESTFTFDNWDDNPTVGYWSGFLTSIYATYSTGGGADRRIIIVD